MIEICNACHTETANVFCPLGHPARIESFAQVGPVVHEARYTCTDSLCRHSVQLHHGSGKTALALKPALFSRYAGGSRSGRHKPGECPPSLRLELNQVAPRNRRRSDRVVDPVRRAAARIRRIDAHSPEVNYLRKLAPPEEVEGFVPRVRELLPLYGAGMRLAKRITGALDETGCPRPSFILAVAAACEELDHEAN